MPVERVRQPGQRFMRDGNELGVEFIEIKTMAYRPRKAAHLLRQRVFARAGVKGIGEGKAEGDRSQTSHDGQRCVSKGRKQFLPPAIMMRGFTWVEMVVKERIDSPETTQR